MPAVEQEHIRELLVRNTHDAYFTELGQGAFHTPYVHVGILRARAMAQVNGELKHRETILQQLLAELGCRLALLLRVRRQIKKYQYPHNSIFAKPVHQICTICKFTMYDLFGYVCSFFGELGNDKVAEDFVFGRGGLLVEKRLPMGTADRVGEFGTGTLYCCLEIGV